MKLTIFGASGKTGRLIVEQALAGGHDVTGFVRDPAKLPISHDRLRLVAGDVADAESVAAAVSGSEAVVSALGSGKGTLVHFANHVLPAMKQADVSRLVSLVGAGVKEPGDPSSFGRSMMIGLMKLVARDVLEDATRHAELLRDSGLDWTLVRPPRLTGEPASGAIQHDAHLQLGPSASISRADLAAFMLSVAVEGQYVRQSPMVANT